MSDDTGPVRFSTDPKDAGGFVNETDSGLRGRLSMERLSVREYFALHLACAMMSSGISQHPRSAISAAIEEVDRFLEELAK